MAFGFVPRYSQKETFENSFSEILLLAVESVRALDWNVGHVSKSRIIAYTSFSMGSWSEQITIAIADQTLSIKSECSGNQMFDWGKNRKNVEAFFTKFYEFRASLSPEELSIRQLVLEISSDESGNTFDQQFQTSQGKITSFFSIFIPAEGYFVTPVIVNLNILLFVLMALTGVNMLLPDNESLITWGANFRSITLDGQWWRLLTSCFLHIGIIHLLMNMYALVYIGLLLELRLGSIRFLAAYLLTGIAGSIASLYWNDLTISAGASGAIFGMYGVFLAMLTTNLIDKASRQAFLTSILVFVGYNLLNGLRGGIDNAAHIGGLVSGLLIGYAFYPGLKKPAESSLKYGTIGAFTAVIIFSGFWVFTHVSNDVGIYEKKMQEFIVLEERALSIYRMDDSVSDNALMDEINKQGIPAWNQCLKLIGETDALDIPDPLRTRNYKLKIYCNLRINAYQLIAKGIEENTEQYLSQIEDYNRQIEVVIDQMVKENQPE